MPKFYTPTFAAPIAKPSPSPCSLEALDLAALRAEDERRARRERIRAELEAARAENARLKADAALKADLDRAPIEAAKPNPGERNAAIDAMVALMVEEGVVAYDAATDQYVRPRSAVWCFNGPRPWALD